MRFTAFRDLGDAVLTKSTLRACDLTGPVTRKGRPSVALPTKFTGSRASAPGARTSSFTCGSWRIRPESNDHRDSNRILKNAC
jgi:hypothetical protein